MAKRGERRPWKVIYEWENGVKGRNAYSDEWTANHKADEIRRAAEASDQRVSVRVEYVAPKG